MKHTKKYLAAFAAFVCTLPLLMAPTGGFPARPRFQAVGINATPGAVGSLTAQTATFTGAVSVNTLTNTGSAVPAGVNIADLTTAPTFSNAAAAKRTVAMINSDTGAAAQGCVGARNDIADIFDACIFSNAGSRIATLNTTSNSMVIHSGSTVNVTATLQQNGTAVCISGSACAGNAPVPITCTTACNIAAIAVGQSAYVSKGTQTDRASTIVPATDPDLQFTNAPVGTYIADGKLFYIGSGGGLGLDPLFSGVAVTSANANQGTMYAPPSGGGCGAGISLQGGGIQTTHTLSYTCTAFGGQTNTTFSNFTYIPSAGSGSFGIGWSQATSNATNTSVLVGSWIKITRIQ